MRIDVVGWHQRLDGYKLQAPEIVEGQEAALLQSMGCKELGHH